MLSLSPNRSVRRCSSFSSQFIFRSLLVIIFSTLLLPGFLASIAAPVWSPTRIKSASLQGAPARITAADDELLEDLEHREFRYFWEQADTNTGLVLDRAQADGAPSQARHLIPASIAATGFGLTAICIAAARHWISREDARERIRATLRFFAERAPQEHGWFYHWLDQKTGARVWQSEVSSIDTALLLAGILTARQAFKTDAEIVRLANLIYDRVDFPWMLNGSPTLLDHGWTPEKGFLPSRWDTYSEETLLYILAIGSRAHPISPDAWYAWARPAMAYAGFSYIGRGPLFTHQYSEAWVDYRHRRENRGGHVDYFGNSIAATRAHRAFCMSLAKKFPGYSGNIWGITASDSAKGYVAWGGPPPDPRIDGTVAPSAAGGSLMFTPDISLPAVRAMIELGKKGSCNRILGRYGLIDAFNPGTGWFDPDVIGIDVGITLLSAENLRSGRVWQWFMANVEPRRALDLIGLKLESR